jgi:hypothetical protein
MRVTRFVLCCLLFASFGSVTLERVANVSISDLTGGTRTLPDLRPGMRYSLHGVTVQVPPPGQGVWFDAVLARGGAFGLGMETDRSGRVSIHDDATTAGLQLAATATTDPCKDGAYKLGGTKWSTDFGWWYQSSSTPTNLYAGSTATALQRAVGHITGGYNNCGLSDGVSATSTYLGATTTSTNISSSAGCLTSDGINVVGFGSLPSAYLGITCWRSMNGVTFEADMRLNKAYYRWYVTKPPRARAGSASRRWPRTSSATRSVSDTFRRRITPA